MSRVHNYTLLLGPGRDAAADFVAAVNRVILSKWESVGGFAQVDQHAGGKKGLEHCVYLFGGNFVPFTDVAEAIVASMHLLEDPSVDPVLVYLGPEDESFTSFSFEQLKAQLEERKAVR